MIMCALEQELRARVRASPLFVIEGHKGLTWFDAHPEVQPTEGPFGLIIAPSRELAQQTYEALRSTRRQLVLQVLNCLALMRSLLLQLLPASLRDGDGVSAERSSPPS